ATITEIEPGTPIVAPAPRVQQVQGKTYVIDESGEQIQEAEPGRPIVIVKKEKAPPPSEAPSRSQKVILYDRDTGERQEVDPGQPVIIMPRVQAQQANQPVIQMKDKDGNDMKFDLATFFQLEDHKQAMEQKREKHDMQIGMMKEIKGLMSKGIKAFSRMSGEEPEMTDDDIHEAVSGSGNPEAGL
ncbi:MAG: hypothetical protein PHQ43_08525, partial [Dehalococcoidales bacterium]|nr:hypothetical protein [Dehalococcoidales bacterium]